MYHHKKAMKKHYSTYHLNKKGASDNFITNIITGDLPFEPTTSKEIFTPPEPPENPNYFNHVDEQLLKQPKFSIFKLQPEIVDNISSFLPNDQIKFKLNTIQEFINKTDVGIADEDIGSEVQTKFINNLVIIKDKLRNRFKTKNFPIIDLDFTYKIFNSEFQNDERHEYFHEMGNDERHDYYHEMWNDDAKKVKYIYDWMETNLEWKEKLMRMKNISNDELFSLSAKQSLEKYKKSIQVNHKYSKVRGELKIKQVQQSPIQQKIVFNKYGGNIQT